MTIDTKKLRELAVKLRAMIDSHDHAAFEMARAEYRVHTHPDALLDLLDEIETSRHVLGGLPQDAIDGGWTALGMSNYAKRLETRRNELLAENHDLRKDAERMEWRPIETAPRDGRNILIRFGKDGASQAMYVPGTPHPWKFIDTNDGFTWLINTARDGEYGPTHWMPLPDAPKVDAALALRESGNDPR